MRQDTYRLRQLLTPVIEAMGYELVGVEFNPSRTDALLRVYIDQETGINVEDCERVSHQISGILDVEDPIPFNYTLEVSSPGLDRPLFEARHFTQFAGQRVRLQLSAPVNGRKKLLGMLQGMQGDEVVIAVDDADLRVPLDIIDKARLVPDFGSGSKRGDKA